MKVKYSHYLKILFLHLLICVFWQQTEGQTLTLKDSLTHSPIELATLQSVSLNKSAVSNKHGKVYIGDFKDAKDIEVRMLGYVNKNVSYSALEAKRFNLYLQPMSIQMDEFVISATRWEEDEKKIAANIIKISSKDIQLQQPQTSADLLNINSSVFIQKSQQGGGSPMIRGFATNRLLYSIDGIRMNTAIFRSGNLQNIISLDPFNVESSEVILGANSVIYGSDAIGGVMNFRTLIPKLSRNDSVLIKGSSTIRFASANNEKTAHSDINIGWKHWASLTSITYNNFDDLTMGSFGPDEYLRKFYVIRMDSVDRLVTNKNEKVQCPSGYTQMNMMQKIRFSALRQWNIEFGTHYSETSDYARYDRHIRYKNGTARYGEWSYGPQTWWLNALEIEQRSANRLYDKMSLRLAYQWFKESRISRDFNAETREIREENVDAYSINADFIKYFAKSNKLYYGAEWVTNEVKSIGTDENIISGVLTNGASRYPMATWKSTGAYLGYNYQLSKKFDLQSGIRYSKYQIEANFDTTFYPFPFTNAILSNNAITGSFGFVYNANRLLAFKILGSSAFRSPNVDDMGKVFDSEPGAVTVPNPYLKAEYVYSCDFGIVFQNEDKYFVDISAFYSYLEDAMVRRDFKLDGVDSIMYDGEMSKVQAIQNAAFATIFGFTVETQILLMQNFKWANNINYQVGVEELDDGSKSPVRHAPPLFGNSRIEFDYKRVNMQLYFNYCAEKSYDDLAEEERGKTEIYAIDDDENPYSPGWYTLNLKINFRMRNNIYISSGIENITDQRYRPYSSGIAGAGRNFIMGITYKM